MQMAELRYHRNMERIDLSSSTLLGLSMQQVSANRTKSMSYALAFRRTSSASRIPHLLMFPSDFIVGLFIQPSVGQNGVLDMATGMGTIIPRLLCDRAPEVLRHVITPD